MCRRRLRPRTPSRTRAEPFSTRRKGWKDKGVPPTQSDGLSWLAETATGEIGEIGHKQPGQATAAGTGGAGARDNTGTPPRGRQGGNFSQVAASYSGSQLPSCLLVCHELEDHFLRMIQFVFKIGDPL